jgi:diguanylate cyclase (GGDEF)-like protein
MIVNVFGLGFVGTATETCVIRVVGQAALMTLVVIAITQAVSYAVWGQMDGGYDLSIAVAGTLIPLVTCFPISMVLLLQRNVLTRALGDLQQTHQQLQEQASRDPMTGLMHRQAFFAKLAAMSHADGCFLMVDVDHFKAVNDKHGHAAGDQALLLIANALAESAGKGGAVARFGGEEFCIFLPLAGPLEAQQVSEKIRRRVERIEFSPGGVPRPLTVSIGVAVAPSGVSVEVAVSAADEALYDAKAAGRNRVICAPTRGSANTGRNAA